ncbi:hypothetical protein SAMN05443244_0900 [Terriglobus roseus]|uniref:Uncharacterized protein n=2 Tax=Terriglobus roseus TaxID=392734 RepID=A0A1H4JZY5_9BACT|nr:hypothetical protein SAMN05443244_0900 [Terriglobus roseus]
MTEIAPSVPAPLRATGPTKRLEKLLQPPRLDECLGLFSPVVIGTGEVSQFTLRAQLVKRRNPLELEMPPPSRKNSESGSSQQPQFPASIRLTRRLADITLIV